jgi:hypothetical protein
MQILRPDGSLTTKLAVRGAHGKIDGRPAGIPSPRTGDVTTQRPYAITHSGRLPFGPSALALQRRPLPQVQICTLPRRRMGPAGAAITGRRVGCYAKGLLPASAKDS